MNAYKRFLKILSRICLCISMAALFLLVALNAYEIAGRYLLSRSNYWIQDVSLLLMMWFLFTGVVVIVHDHQDIWVDMLVNILPPVGKKICSIFVTLISFVFSVMLAYCSYSLMLTRWGRASITAQIPTTWFTMAILFSSLALALIFIRNLYDIITDKAPPALQHEEEAP